MRAISLTLLREHPSRTRCATHRKVHAPPLAANRAIITITSILMTTSALAQAPAPAPAPSYYPPAYYYPPPPPTPKHARDTDRTAALIGSSIGFGVGAAVAGLTYLSQHAQADNCGSGVVTCDHAAGRGALVAYSTIVTFVPSFPRFVVGDTPTGFLYSGLRGASMLAAIFVPWGDDGSTKWQGPFLLGFCAPIALGIIDLATTPWREDVEGTTQAKARPATPTVGFGIAPTGDAKHPNSGALFSFGGSF